jgi:hypothetical protein
VRRIALLAAVAAVYVLAAWGVAPGFYDGFGPPLPYNFVCPPPQSGTTPRPSSGHSTIKVIGGVSDADSAYTGDGQAVIGFLPGAFDPAGQTAITVDVTPLPTCPQPPGTRFVTNVYSVTASAKLVKPASMVLRYSNLLPEPTDVYSAGSADGPWTPHPRNPAAALWTAQISTTSLGYFAAGYSAASPPPGTVRVGGGQLLPIVVAAVIVLVVLAGVPLAVLRRRRGSDESEGEVES